MKELRIVTLGFGTGRQKMLLERWTNPKLSRRACTCEYGLQSCRGKSAGVAKRPRERSPTRNPLGHDSQLFHRCTAGAYSESRWTLRCPRAVRVSAHPPSPRSSLKPTAAAEACFEPPFLLPGFIRLRLKRLVAPHARRWTMRSQSGSLPRPCARATRSTLAPSHLTVKPLWSLLHAATYPRPRPPQAIPDTDRGGEQAGFFRYRKGP